MTAVVSPTVSALSLLSMDPSPAVAAAVQQAAGTRHGLVNLTRLVQALDRQSRQAQRGEWLTVQKTWEVSFIGCMRG